MCKTRLQVNRSISAYEKRFLRNPRMLDIAKEIFFQGLIGSMGDTFKLHI